MSSSERDDRNSEGGSDAEKDSQLSMDTTEIGERVVAFLKRIEALPAELREQFMPEFGLAEYVALSRVSAEVAEYLEMDNDVVWRKRLLRAGYSSSIPDGFGGATVPFDLAVKIQDHLKTCSTCTHRLSNQRESRKDVLRLNKLPYNPPPEYSAALTAGEVLDKPRVLLMPHFAFYNWRLPSLRPVKVRALYDEESTEYDGFVLGKHIPLYAGAATYPPTNALRIAIEKPMSWMKRAVYDEHRLPEYISVQLIEQQDGQALTVADVLEVCVAELTTIWEGRGGKIEYLKMAGYSSIDGCVITSPRPTGYYD